MSLHKGVVEVLPVAACKTLTFLKVCQYSTHCSHLEHGQIKEQESVLYRIYYDVF